MRLPLIALLATTALAGCAADGFRASAWGSSADRPAWRRDLPPVEAPRHAAPDGLDRA